MDGQSPAAGRVHESAQDITNDRVRPDRTALGIRGRSPDQPRDRGRAPRSPQSLPAAPNRASLSQREGSGRDGATTRRVLGAQDTGRGASSNPRRLDALMSNHLGGLGGGPLDHDAPLSWSTTGANLRPLDPQSVPDGTAPTVTCRPAFQPVRPGMRRSSGVAVRLRCHHETLACKSWADCVP